MSSKVIQSTIDEKEIEIFTRMSEYWWNENGMAKPLHTINEIRLPMVKDALEKAGLLKEEFVNSGKPFTGLKILDVGSGGGLFSEPLAKLGAEVTGIDPTEDMIKVAKQHASQSDPPLNINYVLAAVEDHAEEFEGKYDCVVTSEVLEHVANHETFLKGCCKCLRPGGYMFVSTLNKTYIAKVIAIWIAEYVVNVVPRGTHDYKKFITPESVTKILEKYGCKTTEVEGFFCGIRNLRWYKCSPTIHYGLHAIKNSQH